MPDSEGNLKPDEKARAQLWISQQWLKDQRCQICGHQRWEIGGHIVNLHIAIPGAALTIGAPVYPQVLLTCKFCGHTLMFNAVVMGLVEGQKTSESQAESEGDENA